MNLDDRNLELFVIMKCVRARAKSPGASPTFKVIITANSSHLWTAEISESRLRHPDR